MPSGRDVLNEVKWRRGALDRCRVTYVHWGAGASVKRGRGGAENDRATIDGDAIANVGTSFLELVGGTMIPFHRVVRITLGTEVLFDRGSSDSRGDEEGP